VIGIKWPVKQWGYRHRAAYTFLMADNYLDMVTNQAQNEGGGEVYEGSTTLSSIANVFWSSYYNLPFLSGLSRDEYERNTLMV